MRNVVGVSAAMAGAVILASPVASSQASTPKSVFRLTSVAFPNGGRIPRVYTCDGTSRVVPLRWTAPPSGTRSFAVAVDDPDAPSGTFVHRRAWGIPGAARALPGGAPREGLTSAGTVGWVGPCPPTGVHRYVFRVYALRTPLPLRAGASSAAFQAALRGRVLGVARLVGRYGR